MSLKDLQLKEEYRSPGDNMIQDFYVPMLHEAVEYKRAVGFFTSSALIDLSKGLTYLIKNGGKIKLIASPFLNQEDIEAIDKGYAARKKVIEEAVIRNLSADYTDYFAVERLNLLANLIADGFMDIRIAFVQKANGSVGMYHEKMGIISDAEGNKIAFSGSMNESGNAFQSNYETTDVFFSWMGRSDNHRVDLKDNAFDRIWASKDPMVRVEDFPDVSQRIVKMFKKHPINLNLDDEQFPQWEDLWTGDLEEDKMIGARVPDGIKYYDYQENAIDRWVGENYRGIFDMATGTGKTLTGLGAVAILSKDVKDKLAVFILCPYQHLVDQWVDDIVKFNIDPIIGYSSSPQKDWKNRLRSAVRDQKIRNDKSFFCFVCTNATFRNPFVQEQIGRIKTPVLLLVDEAHNIGAESFLPYLDNRFTYRLALSATINRHNDSAGTQALYDYFGAPCIQYGLERAIAEGKLTPYKYFVVPVSLTDEELQEYSRLAREIATCYRKNKQGKMELSRKGKMLAIQRAHLVAAANNKLDALREKILPYIHDRNILVYCGATDVVYEDKDESVTAEIDIKQVDAVTRILGNEYHMKCARFTSQEDMPTRTIIKKKFQEGDLQAIAAIKCLDEGMNIPGIRTAFILASTTNPKEYIQRRGRVLRKAEGKRFAEIYDFVTLPRPIDDAVSLSTDEKSGEKTLIINEIRRMKEFAKASLNPIYTQDLIWDLQSVYNITDKDIEEGGYLDGSE